VTVIEARDRCGGRGFVKQYAGEGPRLNPSDPAWVKAQAAKLFPNARVISHDWHDWVDDPFARGTWVAAFAGHEDGLSADSWQPEGAIAFASSDYAREQAGWFEGAVISGEDAAEAVLHFT
jgi:monoamine oxidase